MLQTFRKSTAEPLPVSTAVVTAVNFSLGARRLAGFAPSGGVVFGGRDEHEIGIFRIPRKAVGIDIGSPLRASPALPAAAAGFRYVNAGAAGDENTVRIARIDQAAVHIIEVLHGAVLVLVQADGVQLAPVFSVIAAF